MFNKLIATSLLIAASSFIAAHGENPILSATSKEGTPGSNATIQVLLENSESMNDLQFDLTLPDASFSIAKDNRDRYIIKPTDRTDTHSPSTSKLSDNTYRVVMASLEGIEIDPGKGSILTIDIVLGDKPGKYDYEISNIEISQKTMVSGVESLIDYHPTNITASISVTDDGTVEYGDYQFYAPTTSINQGDKATMIINFNATGDVSNYEFDIQLPSGIEVEYLEADDDYNIEFEQMIRNFTQDYDYDTTTGIVSMTCTTKKNAVYPESDEAFATLVLDTQNLAPGEYTILLQNQSVTSGNVTYTPADFEAKIIVVGASATFDLLDTDTYTNNTDYHNANITYTRTFKTLIGRRFIYHLISNMMSGRQKFPSQNSLVYMNTIWTKTVRSTVPQSSGSH